MAYRANRIAELSLVAGLLTGVAFMGWINKPAPVAVAAPVDYAGIAAIMRAAVPAPAPVTIATPVPATAAPVAVAVAPAKPAPVAAVAPVKPAKPAKVKRPRAAVHYVVVSRCGCAL